MRVQFFGLSQEVLNRKSYHLSLSGVKDFSLPLAVARLQSVAAGGEAEATHCLLCFKLIYVILSKADDIYDGCAV